MPINPNAPQLGDAELALAASDPALAVTPTEVVPDVDAALLPKFDPDAMFKAAEADREAQLAAIARDERTIAAARARITAAREQIKVDDRILAARTPRKVNRAKK
jgi:hypothetical protein